jgi:hypothetical protein
MLEGAFRCNQTNKNRTSYFLLPPPETPFTPKEPEAPDETEEPEEPAELRSVWWIHL